MLGAKIYYDSSSTTSNQGAVLRTVSYVTWNSSRSVFARFSQSLNSFSLLWTSVSEVLWTEQILKQPFFACNTGYWRVIFRFLLLILQIEAVLIESTRMPYRTTLLQSIHVSIKATNTRKRSICLQNGNFCNSAEKNSRHDRKIMTQIIFNSTDQLSACTRIINEFFLQTFKITGSVYSRNDNFSLTESVSVCGFKESRKERSQLEPIQLVMFDAVFFDLPIADHDWQ